VPLAPADGYLAPLEEETPSNPTVPRTPNKVMKKIPQRIIQNAAGIAIFTCMRSGLWMTGSGGSGILIARKADGTWSPPSGILLHTPTLSFIIGVDIYDCVLVINDLAALESLMRPKVTLGEDVGLTSGPLVALGSTEVDIRWKELGNTVLTYLKARGQSQNVNLNGCILTERSNENERFYSGNVTSLDILAGNVSKDVEETRPVFEVIKAAEGRIDFDAAIVDQLSAQPAPGDAILESPLSASPVSPRPAFGLPNVDDPDPFGVLALEMAGLEIREAGTRLRPSSSQFEYNPSPTSPILSKFQRQSVDTYLSRSNRGSYMSTRTKMSDACTQTDTANTPETTPSPRQSEDGHGRSSFDQFGITKEPEEIDYTKIDFTPLRQLSHSRSLDGTTVADSAVGTEESPAEKTLVIDGTLQEEPLLAEEGEDFGDADDEDDDDEDEEPVVFEVAAAVQPVRPAVIASQVIQAKGSLVTISKRIPPPLPMRSPARNSRASKSDIGDVIAQSPLRQSFNETEFHSEDPADSQNKASIVEETQSEAVDDVSSRETETDEVEVDGAEAQSFSVNHKHSSSVYTAHNEGWSLEVASDTTNLHPGSVNVAARETSQVPVAPVAVA
jgi:lipid-binding SYLF domain-containing protein